jgi:pimeloyl-ACP methyl ester carboxylesterase
MLENAGRLLGRDMIMEALWPNIIVSDDSITQCVIDVRRALGRESGHLLRTIPRRGYIFEAEVVRQERERFPQVIDSQVIQPRQSPLDATSSDGLGGSRPKNAGQPGKDPGVLSTGSHASSSTTSEQDIRYCRTPGGVRLAYAVVGQGPPLVRSGRWFTHLEYEWENAARFPNAIIKELATEFQLLRYDARGTGVSDWEANEISLEAWVQDLDTVANAAEFDRFALLGESQSVAVAIAYAARHPERVSKLILYGGYALGWRKRPESNIEQHEAMLTLMRIGWGSKNPAYRQMFTSQFLPDGTKEQFDALNELQRLSTSPEGAVRYYNATGDVDVTGLLPKITAPTLVMHVRGDADVPFEMGRQVAAGISGAQFVALPGNSHALMSDDPALARYLEEIRLFLRMNL